MAKRTTNPLDEARTPPGYPDSVSHCCKQSRYQCRLSTALFERCQRYEKAMGKYAKLCDWVETNIEETINYYRLPLQHH